MLCNISGTDKQTRKSPERNTNLLTCFLRCLLNLLWLKVVGPFTHLWIAILVVVTLGWNLSHLTAVLKHRCLGYFCRLPFRLMGESEASPDHMPPWRVVKARRANCSHASVLMQASKSAHTSERGSNASLEKLFTGAGKYLAFTDLFEVREPDPQLISTRIHLQGPQKLAGTEFF